MKTPILVLLLFSCLLIKAQTTPIDNTNFQQAMASLGDYPAAAITTTRGKINVTPTALPAVISRIFAYTNTSFKSELEVNRSTGLVNISNPYPAETYTVIAFGKRFI
jgi:hypothetical protein